MQPALNQLNEKTQLLTGLNRALDLPDPDAKGKGNLTLKPRLLVTAAEKVKPCKCSCGGEHGRPRNFNGHCWCKGGSCSGKCIPQHRNADDFSALIVSEITGEVKTRQDLFKDAQTHAGILRKLLGGKSRDSRYSIEYEGVVHNFSFTKLAVEQLNQTAKALEGGA